MSCNVLARSSSDVACNAARMSCHRKHEQSASLAAVVGFREGWIPGATPAESDARKADEIPADNSSIPMVGTAARL